MVQAMIQVYLSAWVDESGADEPPNLFPAIYSVIERARVSWRALDLRVAEEQKKDSGWCLVEADVDRALHDEIVAAGGVWLDPKAVTRADIISRIGEEGIPPSPKLDTEDDIKREMKQAHDARVGRWKGR